MALRAGLNPVLGVAYLMRIPDWRNKFPGTHPRATLTESQACIQQFPNEAIGSGAE